MLLHRFRRAARPLAFRLPLAIRRALYPPLRLSYPLDGLRGYFPGLLSKKPIEIHLVNQVVEHLRPSYVCFDVGANIGYYTLLFAKYARKVYAFEPVPDNLRLLRENVALNGLDNVFTCGKAVGAADGEVIRFYAQRTGVDVQAGALVQRDTCFEVDQVSLDAFCEREKVWPDAIKIDVEGYETEVLKGMAKVLESARPVLFLEVHPHVTQPGEDEKLIDGLLERAYRVFSWAEDVEPGGYGFWRNLIEIGSASELQVGSTLALPQDKYSGLLRRR